MNVKTLSFKKQILEVKRLAELYVFAKYQPTREKIVLAEVSKCEDPITSYIQRVEYAYDKLPLFERTIINNDFFFEEQDKWWEAYCSFSFYLKMKKKAVYDFLTNFDDYEKK